ncbi:MAG TPA: TetR/AcrR family transcriptional regulator [Streptosporangiaceae bacterium]|jgi:AcrR family transcriptional regulator
MDVSRARLSPEDWTRAALRALAVGGVAAVRVDVLARDLGISRGSFYWHFTDRDALLKAALEEWERRFTAQVIEQLDGVADPSERFERLVRGALTDESVPGLQPAIMAHADHPVVRPVLRRVTTQRIAYITAIYQDLGLAKAPARRRAVVAYATYLGWLDLRRVPADLLPELTTSKEGEAAVKEIMRMLHPTT